MKITRILLPLFFILTTLGVRATVLYQDSLNYPNGCIETDGLWFCYSPATPAANAFVTNDLLAISTSGSEDSVAAPGGPSYPAGFTNNTGSTFVIASFTLNVTKLPTSSQYFAVLMQITNDTPGSADGADVAHVFCTTSGTSVPGTYHLGLANISTALTASGATNYPQDLATGVTYQVVFSYDPNQGDPYPSATMWINPSSINDLNVYATDSSGESTAQQNISISGIGFSPYIPNAFIGNVVVGTQFSDVDTGVPTAPPAIGVQPPAATNLYSGNNLKLYTAASGIDPTYQWYSNTVAMMDNGSSVIGSTSNILSLTNLQASANYYVVVSDAAGHSTSTVAAVSVNTTPTLPFFTSVPPNQTNVDTAPVNLYVTANGTGPISYQWYFIANGSTITNGPIAFGPTNYFTATYGNSGTYFVVASNSVGGTASPEFNVIVVPPTLVSIAYLHTFLTNSDTIFNIANGQLFDIEGVVTPIGNIAYNQSGTHPLYNLVFIQDGTGGCAVFNEIGASNNPPAGALVNVVTPAESYYGQLEMDPNEGGTVTIISTNNPLPAPQLVNGAEFGLLASNPFSAYGSNIQCSVVSLTNVWLSTSAKTYTVPAGNFPTNGTKALYAWPTNFYYPGETNIEVYVYTYTNPINQLNTNYWGKPIPSYCYELTAIVGLYSPTEVNLYPTRYQDFVTNLPAPFSMTLAATGGSIGVSWPTVVGSTYSLYCATNLLGPWTQNFGLGYYPSVGAYTDTNPGPAKYYKVSSP